MGQGQQKPTINPNQQTNVNTPNTYNNPNTPTNTNTNLKNDEKFLAYIRQALRNCSNNGYLNKDSFNQVLAVLENLGFKRLRDTPLADRLFNVLDKNKTGRVSQQDFSKSMHDIISDRNSALMCKLSPYNTDTFKAYDYDNDNRVSKKQFIQLIEDSWRFAFRILAQKCDGTQYGKLTIRDLENWSTSKIQNLNDQSTKLFNKLDPLNTGFVEFQSFKEFIINSGFNDITANLNMEKVVIPLNLTSLYAS